MGMLFFAMNRTGSITGPGGEGVFNLTGRDPLGAAQDTQRISHLKQYQTGLELYFIETGEYPSTAGERVDVVPNGEPCVTLVTFGYLQTCLTDPSGGVPYWYRSNGSTFAIEAILQNHESPFCEADAYGNCVRSLTDGMGTYIFEPEDF